MSSESCEDPKETAAIANGCGKDPDDMAPEALSTVQRDQWQPAKMMPHLGPWMMPEAEMLPFWQEAGEKPEHIKTIIGFRTKQCADFLRAHCAKHGNKGNVSQCFDYHFRAQFRRPPVNPVTGRIEYWDIPCQAWHAEPGRCPVGHLCPFAHGMYEISYHPAKYKTRLCNGHECRGEAICCFAHGEAEHRLEAPAWYSYSALACALGLGDMSFRGDGSWESGKGLHDPRSGPIAYRGLSQKHRFCASYPNVHQCARGGACAFAHSREEAATPLLSVEEESHQPSALTDVFFTRKFKTLWCPIGAQHDWQSCVYAHTYQDVRRVPAIGYGPQPCPYWSKKDSRLSYLQRCPLGLRCPYSHGAKEQLYHPNYFRTVVCRDLELEGCPRQKFCAFYHPRSERCAPSVDDTDYTKPLPKEVVPEDWVVYILTPPFFQETGEVDVESWVTASSKGRMQHGMTSPSGAVWGPLWCAAPPFGAGNEGDEEEIFPDALVKGREKVARPDSLQALWPAGSSSAGSREMMWSAQDFSAGCYCEWGGTDLMNNWWDGQPDYFAMPKGVGSRSTDENSLPSPPHKHAG